MSKTIIIYYSWTGTTEIVANQISEIACIPKERIIETKESKRNMVNAAMGAFLGMKSKINPLLVDLSPYSNIIIGTPVWVGKFPPAINSFIKKTAFKNKKVYILVSKSVDQDPYNMVNKIKKYIQRRGGEYKDTLYTKSEWTEEKVILPKIEDISEPIKNWLVKNDLLSL